MTEVSEAEGVTQSGVSRALARLEAEIGTPLLRRSGRTLRMTHAGAAFKPHLDALLHHLDDGMLAATAPAIVRQSHHPTGPGQSGTRQRISSASHTVSAPSSSARHAIARISAHDAAGPPGGRSHIGNTRPRATPIAATPDASPGIHPIAHPTVLVNRPHDIAADQHESNQRPRAAAATRTQNARSGRRGGTQAEGQLPCITAVPAHVLPSCEYIQSSALGFGLWAPNLDSGASAEATSAEPHFADEAIAQLMAGLRFRP